MKSCCKFFLSLLLACTTSYAAPAEPVFKDVINQYKTAESIGAYLDSLKKNMSSSDYQYLHQQLTGLGLLKSKPEVKLQGKNSVLVAFAGRVVTLRIQSVQNETYSLNGHTLEFAHDSAETRWKKIAAALPSSGNASQNIWNLFLPRADAQFGEFIGPLVGAICMLTLGFSYGWGSKTYFAQQDKCERALREMGAALKSNGQLTDVQKNLIRDDLSAASRMTRAPQLSAKLRNCVNQLEQGCQKLGCAPAGATATGTGTGTNQ